jgi:hypothetical protein
MFHPIRSFLPNTITVAAKWYLALAQTISPCPVNSIVKTLFLLNLFPMVYAP